MATTLRYHYCWVCIRALFTITCLELDLIWLYIHAFFLQWKLEMNMVVIKGQKALNQVIIQSMSIIDKRQLLLKTEREWLHIEMHEQDNIRSNFGQKTKEKITPEWMEDLLIKGLRRCIPRVKFESHISCFRECRRVWENKPSHSQVNFHFGSWSPDGLLNLQRAIVGVKIHWIESFLIPLKNSWNVKV